MKPKKKKDSFLLLRLYVAGAFPNSISAVANLNAMAQEFLPNRHKIEIIDTLDVPIKALQEGVLVTPTLMIKKGSLPVKTIIGDLSDKPKISIWFEKELSAGKKAL